MGKLFNGYVSGTNVSERQLLTIKYNNSRLNILLLVVFTVINAVLLLVQSGSYFLFSAYIPYFFIDLGMLMCGKYPEEVYTEFYNGMILFDDSFLVVTCVLAAIVVGVYLLCWFMSKKKARWLTTALILISLDTVMMFLLLGFSLQSIFDYLFHAYLIYSLASGVSANKKLRALPPEEAIVEVADFEELPADEDAPQIEE